MNPRIRMRRNLVFVFRLRRRIPAATYRTMTHGVSREQDETQLNNPNRRSLWVQFPHVPELIPSDDLSIRPVLLLGLLAAVTPTALLLAYRMDAGPTWYRPEAHTI